MPRGRGPRRRTGSTAPTARSAHPVGGILHALDADVGVPSRRERRAGRRQRDRPDVTAIRASPRGTPLGPGRSAVRKRPAEEPSVEGRGGPRIRLCGVDPGRDAWWKSVALAHGLVVPAPRHLPRSAVSSPHGSMADRRRRRSARGRGRRLLLDPCRCRSAARVPARVRPRRGPCARLRRSVGLGACPDRRARARARRAVPCRRRGAEPRDHGRPGSVGSAGGRQLERLPPGR